MGRELKVGMVFRYKSVDGKCNLVGQIIGIVNTVSTVYTIRYSYRLLHGIDTPQKNFYSGSNMWKELVVIEDEKEAVAWCI